MFICMFIISLKIAKESAVAYFTNPHSLNVFSLKHWFCFCIKDNGNFS